MALAGAVAVAVACSASTSGTGGGKGAGGSANGSGNGGAGALIGVGGTAGTGGNGVGGTSLGLGGSGAIGGLADGGECDAVSQQAENGFAPIDIIWAIDNSGSMTFEAGEVQNNMNAFANHILNYGLDVHVAVLSEPGPPNPFGGTNGVCIPPPLGSGQCPTDTNLPIFLRVDVSVQSTDSLFKLIQHYPDYKPVLRKKSLKYFAVVSDDESNMQSMQFIQQVGQLEPGWFDTWKFFAVVCDGTPCFGFPPPCETTGAVYMDLANVTGGTIGSLCQGQSNFGSVFQALASTIVQQTELACEWDIPPPPDGQMFERNKVNVRYTPGTGGPPRDIYWVETASECGPEGGWYYDDNDAPTSVQVCKVNCDQMKSDTNGKVDVLFGCFTIAVPK